jgi:hydrogenase/urease accessory protein HupE
MKKLISFVSLSALSSLAVAHGFHDHTAIFAAGEAHPSAGVEHALLLTAIIGAVYLSLKLLKK